MTRLSDKFQSIIRVICVLAFLSALLHPAVARVSETKAALCAVPQTPQAICLADASFCK